MRIEVDGGGYDSATEALFGGNHSAAIHYNALIGKLGGFGAMAGDDKSSEDFTTNYDTAARDAVGACNDLVDAFATLGILTATSIDNHRKANAGSVYGKPPPVYDGGALPGDGPVDVSEYTPPSALGGDDEDLPEFWNLITDYLEGWTWPGADTDRLRQAATAWRTAATNFGGLTSYCDVAVSMFEGQRSPEIPLAIDATKDLRTQVADLATELKAIGDACDDYAEQVDQTREVIRGFLKDLAIEAGITVVVGGIVTFFTAGLGAGGTAAVAGWRLSACARKIIGALTALKAVRAVTTIARTAPQLAKVRSVLAKFKRAKKMDNAADAAEQAAKAEKLARARKTVNDPKLFDPQDLRGMSRKDLEDVLKDWPSKPSNSGDGIVYSDPVNKGRQIRIMPGYPGNRPDPLTHGPYVQVSQNGTKTKIPLEGNPTL